MTTPPPERGLFCDGGCGRRYEDFGLDVIVPTPLWNRITVGPPFDPAPLPESDREGRGGVLCAQCIVDRLATLPDVTAVCLDVRDRRGRRTFVQEPPHQEETPNADQATETRVEVQGVAVEHPLAGGSLPLAESPEPRRRDTHGRAGVDSQVAAPAPAPLLTMTPAQFDSVRYATRDALESGNNMAAILRELHEQRVARAAAIDRAEAAWRLADPTDDACENCGERREDVVFRAGYEVPLCDECRQALDRDYGKDKPTL